MINLDPTDYFGNHGTNMTHVAGLCGLLYPWLLQIDAEQGLYEAQVPVQHFLEQAYRTPLIPVTGGSVSSEGVFSFPEDPDLHPLLGAKIGDTSVYVYEYGFVAIVHDGETFITRMD